MQLNALLLVDKPSKITSHDVVDVLRKVTGIRKIGHAGTLDPLATGLLVMCIGQATRLSQYLTALDKEYEGAMRLGLTSASHDLEGEITATVPVDPNLSLDDIQEACKHFTGNIQQVPPMVSAVKIGGKRLYKLARAGKEIDRPPRSVTVDEFRITQWNAPDAELVVRCSSGVYVRTLCHDVGQQLGCGSLLAKLRRTRVGKFRLEDAATLDALDSKEAVLQRAIPMGEVLDFPSVVVNEMQKQMLAEGNAISGLNLPESGGASSDLIQLKDAEGKLIALAVPIPSAAGFRLQPKCVFTS